MTPLLPDQDPDGDGRRAALAAAREAYRYTTEEVKGVPTLAELPADENFPAGFLVRAGKVVVDQLRNNAAVVADGDAAKREWPDTSWLQADPEDRVGLLIVELMASAISVERDRPDAVEGYRRIFQTLEPPPGITDRVSDGWFAEQRLAGANPLVVRRIRELPEHFPVTEAHFARGAASDTLAAARAEGRLLLCDYPHLDGLEAGSVRGHDDVVVPKHIAAPMALFAVDPGGSAVRPVAIQCAQQPSARHPIFTPGDGVAWEMAKLMVQVADSNDLELVWHVGQCHMRVEPFVISARRQLARSHPVHVLLAPHFEMTLAINFGAPRLILSKGGVIDQALGGTIEASVGVVGRNLASTPFLEMTPPAELARRDLLDPTGLPSAPYRDDALPVWAAIRTFVSGYLALYYPEPKQLHGDAELRAWLAEVASPDGGRVPGLDPGGRVRDIDALADIVSMVLYTASALHAVITQGQFPFVGYAPQMPFAAYGPPPGPGVESSEAAYLAMLPPMNLACLQMGVMRALSALQLNQLGTYSDGTFADPRVAPLVVAFRAALDAAGEATRARNTTRPLPFVSLLPENIPASIHL